MSSLKISDCLKYANLQMAAEALYRYDATPRGTILEPGAKFFGDIPFDVLTTGNLHASKFANETEAKKFASEWTVIEHISNTTTGFSGTLFMNKDTREYTLSFRSTEFLDDAARDNTATNVLEIKEKGWAFGQISDMENWYESIKSRIDGPLSVTGYSLGGHLATAFNLLHPGAASEVVTFNGAGVGKIGDGGLDTTRSNLPRMIERFQQLRSQGESGGLADLLQTDLGRAAYLRGYAGDDILLGGDGHDELLAEAGRDRLQGGAGNDTLDAGDDNDELDGGDDALQGDAGNDTLISSGGRDSLQGGDGDETLTGTSEQDRIAGDKGRDTPTKTMPLRDPIPSAQPMTMAVMAGFEVKPASAAMPATNENQWRQAA